MSYSVLLNVLPPVKLNSPSLSYSILKSGLSQESVHADVHYWNLLLNQTIERFCGLESWMQKELFYRMLPAKALQAVLNQDREAIRDVKYTILGLKPHFRSKSERFTEDAIREGVAELIDCIDGEIDRLEIDKYTLIVFQDDPLQEVWRAYIQQRIKERYPHIPIVVQTAGCLQKIVDNLPPLTTQRQDVVKESNSLYADFSDYFSQVENVLPRSAIAIPVDQSQSVEQIVDEIEHQTAAYNVYKILLKRLDNGPVEGGMEQIVNFCIAFRRRFPRFEITTNCLLAQGISADCIQRMVLAGFNRVPIAYSSVANYLFFLKWAHRANLLVMPLAPTLYKEPESYFYKMMDNLYYCRFFLSKNRLFHSYFASVNEAEDPDERAGSVMESVLWGKFKKMEHYYRNVGYHYVVYPHADGFIYIENVGEVEYYRLRLPQESIEYAILRQTDREILSLDELILRIPFANKEEIQKRVRMLQKRQLLYVSDDMTEIVSIIVLDK